MKRRLFRSKLSEEARQEGVAINPELRVAGAKRRLPRLLVGVAGLFVVGLLVNWWALTHSDPGITIPKRVLPNPNGYDLYVAAGRAMVNTKKANDVTMTLPVIGSRTPEQERSLEQLEAELQQNAGAFATLHQGFAHECRLPFGMGPTTDYAILRNVARTLFAQSRAHAARGDWGGAADSALDGIQMGEEIQHGGAIIPNLVGGACEAIGQRPMWEIVEHLNVAQSLAAAKRLQTIMNRQVGPAKMLEEEKWVGLNSLQQIFRSVRLRTAIPTAAILTPEGAPAGQHYRTALALLYGQKRIAHDYNAYMDQVIKRAQQPYGLHLPQPAKPQDPIGIMLMDAYQEAELKDVATRTQNGLLLVTLALHTFRLEQGHYPTALPELVSGNLQRLPDDPFAAQGTFQYHLQGEHYTLYSVGPDGKDDNGTPMNDLRYLQPGEVAKRYDLTQKTRGDIVARINFP